MMVTAPLGSMRTKAFGVNAVVAEACAAALAAPGRQVSTTSAPVASTLMRQNSRRESCGAAPAWSPDGRSRASQRLEGSGFIAGATVR